MSDDLITLLRELAAAKHGDLSVAADAADEIEDMLADAADMLDEVERLRAALKRIDELNPDVPDALVASDLRDIVAQMGDLAVKALGGKP